MKSGGALDSVPLGYRPTRQAFGESAASASISAISGSNSVAQTGGTSPTAPSIGLDPESEQLHVNKSHNKGARGRRRLRRICLWASHACAGPLRMATQRVQRRVLAVRKRVFEAWKSWDEDRRMQIAFIATTTMSTLLFLIMFECLFFLLAEMSYAFSVAYIGAYLMSVFWQHTLNQIVVFGGHSSRNYWESLIQSYFVYSVSLFISSLVGTVLVSRWELDARLVSYITLPATGVANFLVLRAFVFERRVDSDDRGTDVV